MKNWSICLCLIATINFDMLLGISPNNLSKLLGPCTFTSERSLTEISCANVTGAALKQIFSQINNSDFEEEKKQMKVLKITGQGCDQILENTFSNINFNAIMIYDAPNLSSIYTNAFGNNRTDLIWLALDNLPSLDVNNLFDIINQFSRFKILHLTNLFKLREIPSLAFKGVDHLKQLKIIGKNIKKINEKAFYNLNSLETLIIINTSIASIGENIFVFSQDSDQKLTVYLFDNPDLICKGFTEETFSDTNRYLLLNLIPDNQYIQYDFSQKLTCMPEEVFRPFFETPYNEIDMNGNYLNCSDCQNFWLKNETKIHERIFNFKCENGKDLTYHDNFKGC